LPPSCAATSWALTCPGWLYLAVICFRKYPSFLSDFFYGNLNFLETFLKVLKYQVLFLKKSCGGTIVPCGQADGRRHMMKSPKIESKFQNQLLQHKLNTNSQRQQQASDLCRNSSSGFSQPPMFPKAPPCLTLAGPCIVMQFKYINQPDATVLQVYYLTFCVAQHVSGASTPIIRSLQLH
jgi:hypothetical protein